MESDSTSSQENHTDYWVKLGIQHWRIKRALWSRSSNKVQKFKISDLKLEKNVSLNIFQQFRKIIFNICFSTLNIVMFLYKTRACLYISSQILWYQKNSYISGKIMLYLTTLVYPNQISVHWKKIYIFHVEGP